MKDHGKLIVEAIISLVFFHMVRTVVSWHKIHDTHAFAFAVETK